MQQLFARIRCWTLMLFGCWGLIFWVVSSAAAQGAGVWLDPATLDLAPGDVGTLDIRVENVARLAGAEVHLAFDPVLLEVVDAEPSAEGTQIAHGDFLSPDFVAQNDADQRVGTVDYAIACLPADKEVSGSGVLARVTVRALAEGETLVPVNGVLLADSDGQPISVETESGVVVIRRPGPSPVVLVLIGLVAVAVAVGSVAVVWNSIRARQLVHDQRGDGP
jgi:hypothetical protein